MYSSFFKEGIRDWAETERRQSRKLRGKYSCGKLCVLVTVLDRCHGLLSYITLIDPDFRVYKCADGQFQIGVEKQAAWCLVAECQLHSSPAQLGLSRCPLSCSWSSDTEHWTILFKTLFNLIKYGEIPHPFFACGAVILLEEHKAFWDQSNAARWVEQLSVDLSCGYLLLLLIDCVSVTASKRSELQ